MKIKISIYIFIVLGVLFLERKINLFDKLIFPDMLFISIVIIPFLFLLFLHIKRQVNKNSHSKEIKKTGFIFSFWIGVVWGILISFSRGFPKFNTFYVIVMNFLGYATSGLIVGLIGMGISIIIWNNFYKENKNKGFNKDV